MKSFLFWSTWIKLAIVAVAKCSSFSCCLASRTTVPQKISKLLSHAHTCHIHMENFIWTTKIRVKIEFPFQSTSLLLRSQGADPPLRLKRFDWLKLFPVEFKLTNQRSLLKEHKERTCPTTIVDTILKNHTFQSFYQCIGLSQKGRCLNNKKPGRSEPHTTPPGTAVYRSS